MKVLAFSGSNSSVSINHQLLRFAATKIDTCKVINLRTLTIPMYSYDEELENGIPPDIHYLLTEIKNTEGLLVSTPEHNNLMPAFFKNVLDWLSRTGVKYLENKTIVLMSTSNGARGAISAAASVEKMFARVNGVVKERFSLPHFEDNFDSTEGKIVNSLFNEELIRVLNIFKN